VAGYGKLSVESKNGFGQWSAGGKSEVKHGAGAKSERNAAAYY
jgi:hypothetical protein